MYVSLRNTPTPATTDPDDAVAPTRRELRRSAPVPGLVLTLGLTSLFTDISAETITAVLPLYVFGLLAVPLVFGSVDGIYPGAIALVRLLGGWSPTAPGGPSWWPWPATACPRWPGRGWCRSAGSRPLPAVVALRSAGQGPSDRPRDAMIAGASPPDQLGRNFGVHRALDMAGAMPGRCWRSRCWPSSRPPGGLPRRVRAEPRGGLIGLAFLLRGVPSRGRRPDRGRARGQPVRRWRWRDLGDRRLLSLTLGRWPARPADGRRLLPLPDAGGRIQLELGMFPLLFVATTLSSWCSRSRSGAWPTASAGPGAARRPPRRCSRSTGCCWRPRAGASAVGAVLGSRRLLRRDRRRADGPDRRALAGRAAGNGMALGQHGGQPDPDSRRSSASACSGRSPAARRRCSPVGLALARRRPGRGPPAPRGPR